MRQLACFPDGHQHQLVQLLEPGCEQLVIVQQFVGGEQLVVFELAVLVQQLVSLEQLQQLVQQPLLVVVIVEQQLVVLFLVAESDDVKDKVGRALRARLTFHPVTARSESAPYLPIR